MPSQYSDNDKQRALQTLQSVDETISRLIDWNANITSSDDYYSSQSGMQLLAANCTLITAIGEGINRINRILPDFLQSNFSEIPWKAIIGMRNHIAHGYFEIDADIIFDAISSDITDLQDAIKQAANLLQQ